MLKKLRKHKHFPHIVWSVIVILVLVLLFSCSQRAHSGLQIIDTHEHIQSVKKADELVLAMDKLGIDKMVIVPSPIETILLNGSNTFTRYRENVDEMLKIADKYPNRFIPLCTISPVDSDALEYFKECHQKGGKGLKLYNGHSFFYEHFANKLDSETMKPIYAYAESNNLPVLFHININNYQKELENVLKEYPNLTVSIPHFMVSSVHPDKVSYILDTYPNTYTDISFGHTPYFAAGFRRISNDIPKYIEFFERHPDRILFGADMVLTEIKKKDQEYMETVLKCYRDILEKQTFKCSHVSNYYKEEAEKNYKIVKGCNGKTSTFCKSKKEKFNSFSSWFDETKVLNGLNLSSDALRMIYVENAERFLNANK